MTGPPQGGKGSKGQMQPRVEDLALEPLADLGGILGPLVVPCLRLQKVVQIR